jgi:hypothetical protein
LRCQARVLGAAYDLDKQTLRYIIVPGFTGRRHRLKPAMSAVT